MTTPVDEYEGHWVELSETEKSARLEEIRAVHADADSESSDSEKEGESEGAQNFKISDRTHKLKYRLSRSD